jgi:hypothetical protein
LHVVSVFICCDGTLSLAFLGSTQIIYKTNKHTQKKHSKETKNNENKETINQKIQETTKPQPQKQVKNAGIKQNPQKPKT